MTARSVLNRVADDLCSDGMNGVTIGDQDAAALRELDQLLQDMTAYINERCSDKASKLQIRAAQAGYGEK